MNAAQDRARARRKAIGRGLNTGKAALFVLALTCGRARAGEYFVGTAGADSASGRSEAEAFATVGRGLNALAPGDTLTILPGEYFGANSVSIAGAPGKPITIRAKAPGTATLRGDVDVSGFERVEGLHYTWVAPFARAVEGVAERDTSRMYAFVPSIAEVEELRRSCYHDAAAGKLYVHTSDSGTPAAHDLIASVTREFGILFRGPRGERGAHDIVVEGLTFTGYMNRETAPLPGYHTRWGLYFLSADRCVVRNCRAYLNGGGIGLVQPNDCLVEDCIAYGNGSTFNAAGGNIICWTPARNTVMRRNIVHTTDANGIRFYGGGSSNCVLESNLAYGCDKGEIWIKGGGNRTSRIVRNVSLGMIHNSGGVPGTNILHNLCRYGTNLGEDPSNVQFSRLKDFSLDANFADPAHHDYRLQSDSVLRGQGPGGTDPGPFPYRGDVFFLGPGGNDRHAGTSVREAWATVGRARQGVKRGQTVYCLPDMSEPAFASATAVLRDVTVRRRGEPDKSHFAYRPVREKMPLRIEHVRVHGVTATTANLEWWTPAATATTTLEWGETPECKQRLERMYQGTIFHTVSLTGLKPGATYYYRVSATSPAWEFHTTPELARLDREKPRNTGQLPAGTFTTPARDPSPRLFHVATNGWDGAAGTARRPWRTLRHAAGRVLAGDTVVVHGGIYQEHIPVRATGTAGRPITFRAAPGEQVWLEGSAQRRPTSFRLAFKHHVHLDGFFLRHYRKDRYDSAREAGAIEVIAGSHNVVRRCFYDGRSPVYKPYAVRGDETESLLVENCVVIGGWNGLNFRECPNVTVRNCVLYNNAITELVFFNQPGQPATLTRCIVADNVPMKVHNALVQVWHLECFSDDSNCYFARRPESERPILGYTRRDGVKKPAEITLAELRALAGQGRTSFFANPGMRVVSAMRPLDHRNATDQKIHQREEMHMDGDTAMPLSFEHFFADPGGPCGAGAAGAPIGLDPGAFGPMPQAPNP